MRTPPAALVLALGLLAGSKEGGAEPTSRAVAVGEAVLCKVERVVDGDTFFCAGRRHAFRLRGADAFELAEPKGKPAGDFLRSLIKGRTLVCWGVQEEPSHDRPVVACSLPGSDLSEVIIRNGYARACAAYGGGALNALEPVPVEGPGWCEGRRP